MVRNFRSLVSTFGHALRQGKFSLTASGTPTLVYLHIPKTAGTSMRKWLVNTYGHGRVFWEDQDQNRAIDAIMHERGVEYFDRYAAIGGHIEFTNPSIQALAQPKIYSTVFRRPAEQVVSHFEYVSRRPQHELHTGGTLEDALASDNAFLRASTNMQCRLATGSANAADALKTFEENQFVLGCFDYLAEFRDCIASKLGVLRRKLPRRNVQDSNYFQKHYTPRVAEIVEEITQEDEAVYQFVLKKRVYCTGRIVVSE